MDWKPERRSNGDTGRSGPRLNLGALPLLGGGPLIRPGARTDRGPERNSAPAATAGAGSPERHSVRINASCRGGYVVGPRPEERSESAEESDLQRTPPSNHVNGLVPHVPRTKTSLRLRRIRRVPPQWIRGKERLRQMRGRWPLLQARSVTGAVRRKNSSFDADPVAVFRSTCTALLLLAHLQ